MEEGEKERIYLYVPIADKEKFTGIISSNIRPIIVRTVEKCLLERTSQIRKELPNLYDNESLLKVLLKHNLDFSETNNIFFKI